MKRIFQKEWIDLGPEFYSEDEYEDCLYQLSRVGKLLGGDRAALKALNTFSFIPESILDIGCGGGYFAALLAKKFPNAQVVGRDFSSQAIAHAKKRHASIPNLTFEVGGFPEQENVFDLVVSTLVCHHLAPEEFPSFIRSAYSVSKKGILFNDLHRSWIPYLFFKCVAPFIFKNRLITHDGLLSIRKSFVKKDWKQALQKASLAAQGWNITWFFPFRWIVQCEKNPL